jgi:hypothetical protein
MGAAIIGNNSSGKNSQVGMEPEAIMDGIAELRDRHGAIVHHVVKDGDQTVDSLLQR